MIFDMVGQVLWMLYIGIKMFFQVTLGGIFAYYFFSSMFAWKRRKEKAAFAFQPKHRFAVLVAAHNEQAVIANIIDSLKCLNYPKNLYDVYVIADNCTDETAKIARKNGVIACERFNSKKRGKGFALEWMFEKLFKMDKKYDAIAVLDADNLVSNNFLMEMNKHICMGHDVIQGYLDSKNPYDTWISGNNSIAFWIVNRLMQLPRYYLGLSCLLGGTGFAIKTDVLKEFGWGATCLAEDLEFSLKLIMQNRKVYWAHDAVIYDEKPLTIAESWRQRKRWMQGHFDCFGRFFPKLFKKSLKERDRVAFDALIYLVNPIVAVANGIGVVFGLAQIISNALAREFAVDTVVMTIAMFMCMYLSVIFVIIEGKMSFKIMKYLLLLPVYNLTWVPIIIQGIRDRNKTDWFHTTHTRSIDIAEIEKLGRVG